MCSSNEKAAKGMENPLDDKQLLFYINHCPGNNSIKSRFSLHHQRSAKGKSIEREEIFAWLHHNCVHSSFIRNFLLAHEEKEQKSLSFLVQMETIFHWYVKQESITWAEVSEVKCPCGECCNEKVPLLN